MVFVNGCVDFFVLVFIVIVYFIILLLFEGEECEFVFLIELFLFKFVLEFWYDFLVVCFFVMFVIDMVFKFLEIGKDFWGFFDGLVLLFSIINFDCGFWVFVFLWGIVFWGFLFDIVEDLFVVYILELWFFLIVLNFYFIIV